ncbi:hypothetical protein DLR65_12415 [Vibrio tarriae]|uniref:hypothetical protein n=1 Tax=Vibrio tarriae TaxID=2014742 RepID=UPI000DE47CE0|nr:hypothetical protein [Vibrio tarriae]RBM48474.1 hypothetical protein DLR65_12415 [Vibrio tarriae]
MNTEVINREAGDSGKGFRLQAIRAIKLMIESINNNANAIFFTAVENVEDVSHLEISDGEVHTYYEEDKNYDTSSNFTIFSPPVINTLVSFFDIYINHLQSSDRVYLGFYSTRNIGKERKTALKNGDPVTLPTSPLLELLLTPESLNPNEIQLVKAILIDEYISQYSGKAIKGNLVTLQDIDSSSFVKFLKQIKWHFGQEDEEALERTVISDIQKSPLYHSAHVGKEGSIFALLFNKLSRQQNKEHLIDKLVHSSDVKLAFKDAESIIPDKSLDPTWKYLEELSQEINDKRNLADKVLDMIKDYPEARLTRLARKACRSKIEESESDRSFLSLKYRVYEACQDYFYRDGYKEPKENSEIDEIFSALLSRSVGIVEKLKGDYHYSISNEVAIEGIVLDLFDRCFLAFEEC